MIVDWMDADSIEATDAILVCHGVAHMQYTDDMLHHLIDTFDHDEYDYIIVSKFRAELARRERLDQ